MRQRSKGEIKYMIDTIKQYLVSLGFNVDKQSYGEATKAMDGIEKTVAKFAGGAVREFAMAGAAVTAFVATATVGIAKLVGDLAQADLANEKLARQMWTSKDNAMAFNNSLKAMKATLDDLYLSPELMNNFKQLRSLAFQLRPPAEYQQQMKFIRSIQFEFTKMKLEATYALQWIGYYLIKHMEGPLTKIKAGLMGINDAIIKNMPMWTKEVARVLTGFLRAGETIVRVGGDLGKVFEKLGDQIPEKIKLIGAALLGLGVILKTGPIGIFMFAIAGLILLLDDFYTYMDGGDAQFGAIWEKLPKVIDSISTGVSTALKDLKEFWDSLKDSEAADKIKSTAENTVESLKIIFGGVRRELTDIYDELEKRGEFTKLKENFLGLGTALAGLGAAWSGMIKQTLGLKGTQELMSGLGHIIKTVVVEAVDILNTALKGTKLLIKGITDLINGDLDGLGKVGDELKNNVKDNLSPNTGSGLQSFSDSLINGLKNFNSFYGKMFNNPWNGPSYMYPSSNTNNNNNSKVSLTQTNNIYGSDPKATADAVNENGYAMLTRNMRGANGW
jgi:hypothetical protein